MNWGNKLLLVFVLFAGLIGTLVYKAVNTRFDLVSKDYYKQELRYQQRIDGMANVARTGSPVIEQNDAAVIVTMPESFKGLPVKGEAWFYRKSNADADIKIALNLDAEGMQVINKKLLFKGPYQLKLDWVAEGRTYYVEKELQVN